MGDCMTTGIHTDTAPVCGVRTANISCIRDKPNFTHLSITKYRQRSERNSIVINQTYTNNNNKNKRTLPVKRPTCRGSIPTLYVYTKVMFVVYSLTHQEPVIS
ncbi:hypothetical protein J6590_006402 [Homalodisca vitripennis]|nr:hypothetical protein J6590_006402 [Homalodisca vitripennis]